MPGTPRLTLNSVESLTNGYYSCSISNAHLRLGSRPGSTTGENTQSAYVSFPLSGGLDWWFSGLGGGVPQVPSTKRGSTPQTTNPNELGGI